MMLLSEKISMTYYGGIIRIRLRVGEHISLSDCLQTPLFFKYNTGVPLLSTP